MRLRPLVLAPFLLGTLFAATADADWPVARHDPARTGATGGVSDVAKPVPYWKSYLGGLLAGPNMLPADVDKDGVVDIVYVSGGRVIAKTTKGSVIWESASYGVGTLYAIDDLDGDGTADIVTATSNRVMVLSSKTGALEWAEEEGEMGSIGAIRVADLDSDKKPDIYVQECGCCGVNSGKTGFAYGFAAGFGAPKKLWTAPYVSCGGGRSTTVFDADGDGKLEIIDAEYSKLHLLSGATGVDLAATPDYGAWTSYSFCQPANVDGKPGDELVCAKPYVDALPSNHELFVLRYDATAATFTKVWSKDIGDMVGLRLSTELVLDLDGDGKLEVLASGRLSAGGYQTYVLDAATGTELAKIPETIEGAARLESTTKATVLTSDSGAISAWSFNRAATPSASFRWKITGRVVATWPDPAAVRTTSLYTRTVAADLDGDGFDDLVTFDGAPGSEMTAHSGAGGSSVPFATYKLPAGASTSGIWLTPAFSPYARLALARNDGFLTLHDNKLNVAIAGPPKEVSDKGAIRIGGYYAAGGWADLERTPVVAALGAVPAQSIVVPDSRGALLRIEAKDASFASPPTISWARLNTTAPSIVPKLDGGTATGIACLGRLPPLTAPKYEVVALRGDGAELWTAALDGLPMRDVLPGKIDDDGIPDLTVQWGKDTDLVVFSRALNGATGKTFWDSPPNTPGAGRQAAGHSFVDWNGDGKTDVIFQGAGTHVLSGVDGKELATGGPGDAYFLPTVYDVDGDGSDDLVLHGGYSPARTLKHDLKTAIWTGIDDDRPYPYGAIAKCAGTGPVLVEGSWQHPSRLKITTLSGTNAGVYTTVVLANGAVFASEAIATAAGARLGQLTSAAVHADLSGATVPRALVGSTDGFLYAIDPCSGKLVFSYEFKAPVGQPVFGDTDGDGKDEIIVSVADGYLYGLKNDALPVPEWVWDIDPEHGATSADVSFTENRTTLSGKWAAVTGADKYEVAVVGPDGKYLTTPPWTDVGNVTQTTIGKLALSIDARYTFAVRAISTAKGRGPDTVSDGVTIIAASPPDAGDGGSDASDGGEGGPADSATDGGTGGPTDTASGGCGCDAPGRRGAPGALAFTAISGLFLLLRRRRPTRRPRVASTSPLD